MNVRRADSAIVNRPGTSGHQRVATTADAAGGALDPADCWTLAGLRRRTCNGTRTQRY